MTAHGLLKRTASTLALVAATAAVAMASGGNTAKLPNFTPEQLKEREARFARDIKLDEWEFQKKLEEVIKPAVAAKDARKWDQVPDRDEAMKALGITGPNAPFRPWKAIFDISYAYLKEQDDAVGRYRDEKGVANITNASGLMPSRGNFGMSTKYFDFRRVSLAFVQQQTPSDLAIGRTFLGHADHLYNTMSLYEGGMLPLRGSLTGLSKEAREEDIANANLEFKFRNETRALRVMGMLHEWIRDSGPRPTDSGLRYFRNFENRSRSVAVTGEYDNGPVSAYAINVSDPTVRPENLKWVHAFYSGLELKDRPVARLQPGQ